MALPQPPVAVEIDRPGDIGWTATKPEIAKPAAAGRRHAALRRRQGQRAGGVLHAVLGRHSQERAARSRAGVVRHHARHRRVSRPRKGNGRTKACGSSAIARAGSWRPGSKAGTTSGRPISSPSATSPWAWCSRGAGCELLYGCGSCGGGSSADGQHWAELEMAHDSVPPRDHFDRPALVANRPDTHLTLRRIVLRRLAGLSALANDELFRAGPGACRGDIDRCVAGGGTAATSRLKWKRPTGCGRAV